MKHKNLTVLFAHGSSNPRWKEQIETLTAYARTQHDNVEVAYMELCSPTLREIIEAQIHDTAQKDDTNGEILKTVHLIPLFLATGKHLEEDIPRLANSLGAEFNIDISIADAIGLNPILSQAINEIVDDQLKQLSAP
ncbi:cobalamin (vitamin B12) biosynthesis protein CbiX [Oleiphilus messinensis]|uniref:Cobalamin (Vitamin B12) biosynthesis protein CbiX n=1 Tax=Oleiphilus messinensis TaxID=141451 RepID=A0A1Y0I8J4_9GAMM|nr:CbiX/SirB N-terminal domain-containing protein [Oleiphilus messinensis]ARU56560.1 cobalamin (vitamin B12) biosynthesis protein CbiX [Oleiphilus messinensis]